MIVSPKNIAIFASGAGSNAAKIITFSQQTTNCPFTVAVVVCNKKGAGVATIAATHGIPVLWIEKERFFSGDAYLPELAEFGVDWIVLAGFLWKIPAALIAAYPQKIINIHPALLPNYGGKGMYGHFVHEAVIAANETESGITIHFVDEQYDHGATIFQATCNVTPNDTPETLAAKVHSLEHLHFARVVAEVVGGRI